MESEPQQKCLLYSNPFYGTTFRILISNYICAYRKIYIEVISLIHLNAISTSSLMQLIATKTAMSKYETPQTDYNDLMHHQYFNVYHAFDLHVYYKNQNFL